MQAAGYDISILFGIPNFYHKFGYVRGWSSPSYKTGVDGLPVGQPAGRVRKFKVRYSKEREKLYNRLTRQLTGFAVRPTFTQGASWSRDGYEWRDAQGALAGYVYVKHERDTLVCGEAVGAPEQVLRVLRKVAQRVGCGQVEFRTIHPESALGRRLRWGNCEERTGHAACAGAMARIIDLQSLVAKLSPEFEARLRACGVQWNGTLAFGFGSARAAVKIRGTKVACDPTYGSGKAGKSKHSVTGGDHMIQLLMGTDDPESVIAHGKLKLAGDAKFLVPILCPNRHPELAEWDRY
jgi:hypothetical protein